MATLISAMRMAPFVASAPRMSGWPVNWNRPAALEVDCFEMSWSLFSLVNSRFTGWLLSTIWIVDANAAPQDYLWKCALPHSPAFGASTFWSKNWFCGKTRIGLTGFFPCSWRMLVAILPTTIDFPNLIPAHISSLKKGYVVTIVFTPEPPIFFDFGSLPDSDELAQVQLLCRSAQRPFQRRNKGRGRCFGLPLPCESRPRSNERAGKMMETHREKNWSWARFWILDDFGGFWRFFQKRCLCDSDRRDLQEADSAEVQNRSHGSHHPKNEKDSRILAAVFFPVLGIGLGFCWYIAGCLITSSFGYLVGWVCVCVWLVYINLSGFRIPLCKDDGPFFGASF